MMPQQFDRLTGVFWKTGKPDELATTFREYRKALTGFDDRAVDIAIDRAIREGEKMPLPSKLRAWAFEAKPKMPEKRDGMVRCSKCDEKGRVTFMPTWTHCHVCNPGADTTPRPLMVFPQSTFEQAERHLNGEQVDHIAGDQRRVDAFDLPGSGPE